MSKHSFPLSFYSNICKSEPYRAGVVRCVVDITVCALDTCLVPLSVALKSLTILKNPFNELL